MCRYSCSDSSGCSASTLTLGCTTRGWKPTGGERGRLGRGGELVELLGGGHGRQHAGDPRLGHRVLQGQLGDVAPAVLVQEAQRLRLVKQVDEHLAVAEGAVVAGCEGGLL